MPGIASKQAGTKAAPRPQAGRRRQQQQQHCAYPPPPPGTPTRHQGSLLGLLGCRVHQLLQRAHDRQLPIGRHLRPALLPQPPHPAHRGRRGSQAAELPARHAAAAAAAHCQCGIVVAAARGGTTGLLAAAAGGRRAVWVTQPVEQEAYHVHTGAQGVELQASGIQGEGGR
jgi:hypothetical protein